MVSKDSSDAGTNASPSESQYTPSGESSIIGLRKVGEDSAQHTSRVCEVIMPAALPAAQTWQEKEQPTPATMVGLSATRILITGTLVMIMSFGT